jgi:hypothetical protein
LAFLQAFTDDSASEKGDRRLFLAGYLNSAEKWALFSEAWDEELRAAPSIEYLHTVEALNLRDQFDGWSIESRDRKLRGLARIIRHFEPISFQFSVSRERFYNLVKPVSPRGLNPHFTCCFGVVASVSSFAASQKGNIPIDFIFDDQDGVSADIQFFFEHMIQSLPAKSRKLINSIPIFRNDKQFIQLQAADMLAWHLRREHEDGVPESLALLDVLRIPGRHVISEIEEPMLKDWATHHSQQPGIDQLQTKGQWRNVKKDISAIAALGLDPATIGVRKNMFQRMREKIAKLFRC